MTKSIQEIQKVLKPFTKRGITRTSLNDYAIIVFPRGMADSLTPELRKRVENKYDKILLDNNIRKNFYIHFGMCTRRCSGCHYGTITRGNKDEAVKTILNHIDLFSSHRYFLDESNFYFGGGTPSLMSAEQIKLIYDKIVNKFNIKKVTRSTLEVHPEIIRVHSDPENYIKQLKKIGITRISLGMQECDNKILKKWERGHTKSDALKTYKLIKKYKFETGIDLMWNLPNQTLESLEKCLRTAFELDPETVCTYFFWLKPGTKDYELYKKGKLKLLNKPVEMKYLIKSIASEYGYKQRLIEWFHKERNSAKYPPPVRHPERKAIVSNMNLITISFGPSSYSYLFSGFEENYILWSPFSRDTNDAIANDDYRKMIDSGIKPYDRVLIFKKEETIRLHLMFRLRSGSLSKEILEYFIKESADKEIETLVNNYIKCGLLTWDKNCRLVFTDAGEMMPNHIIATFTTDAWLTKMIKRRNEKEDRYFWFPDAEKTLKLKNIIKNGLKN